MRVFRWDNEKNERLNNSRGVCFEQVVILMGSGDVFDTIEHPNQERYPGQKITVIKADDYVHLVPYVENGEELFLKTIIPSRKAFLTRLWCPALFTNMCQDI